MQRRRGERVDSMLDDLEADRSLAREWGIRAAIFVPLLASGEPIGAIAVNDHGGRIPLLGGDDRLVQEFADRAAIAIDLSGRVQRDTVSRILGGQELERKRIARELHDETGQALTAILLGLKPLEAADETRQTRCETRQERARERAQALGRSAPLRARRLRSRRRARTAHRRPAQRTDLTIDFAATRPNTRLPERWRPRSTASPRRPSPTRSGTRRRTIPIGSTLPERSRLTVADDGRDSTPRCAGDRFGLLGMRERTALINGAFDVVSRPGHGTTVSAEAPLDAVLPTPRIECATSARRTRKAAGTACSCDAGAGSRTQTSRGTPDCTSSRTSQARLSPSGRFRQNHADPSCTRRQCVSATSQWVAVAHVGAGPLRCNGMAGAGGESAASGERGTVIHPDVPSLPGPCRSPYGTTIMNETFQAAVQCGTGLGANFMVRTAKVFAGHALPASGSATVTPSVWERENSARDRPGPAVPDRLARSESGSRGHPSG